ncbi:putative trafficking protein particle complex subunit 13 homolog [Caenorhabditis elegans]|uniref:Probable trafficking protein particle complex subunit 13 homolog n=2 Tax=Caenorhabditis elegans TaxID=6239 RepID=TPC13_CAEEL|nr:putative trafficking protein particle complex subunit 13 homolog [Caenorhabditis elegans]Q95QQ2.1 RecName: Full=Probable trafficking protein particle complex subunit 13 homolog [Caenorhabditis elegans]CCD68177.1 Probable trafficking protein particle complex subunit 13 homolog [Caenorhabditis elegans]|eukprot:NP_741009.1 Probable trafficking protein particle complex subunit 13 homolog [Caenorhabditis elegans]
MADNPASSSSQQLLALRVMRLARPKFAPVDGFSHDPVDPTGFGELLAGKVSEISKESRQDLPIGEYLIAPQMFENIYLGETFTFYVNVVNESEKTVSSVSLKCELQTSTQRVVLPCSVQDATIESSKCEGQVISHEVKEIGQHILICSVNYKTSNGENMYFRKFFKFPVSKPIDVKTKFYSAEDNANQDVYLEAQIENTSNANMFLEKVELDPSQHYNVTSIAHEDEFGDVGKLLKPKDIRQFLFCLTPADVHNTLGYKDLTSIGKLDMSWRTSMGEKGRLQTSALQRIAPGYGDVRLSVEKTPACVDVQKPFEVSCRLYNCSERALDLQLRLEQPSNRHLVFCSPSGVSLGQLPPSQHVDFSLNVFPVTVGIQSISGIRITDTFTKRIYEHDDIAQIFVS